jgi:3-hydroxymyristoyl/3-hydroxydecanoyl-(acyl carrier protein) dehydratase
VPRRFRFVEALPVDSQGKASQRALAQLFAPERPVPQWLVRGPTQATLQVEISPGLRVLEGHFPDAPVVPGVAQLDWAIRWGQEVFCPAGEPSRVEVLKFQAPLLPGQRAELELGWSAATRTLTFRFAAQALTFSSGRVVFSP